MKLTSLICSCLILIVPLSAWPQSSTEPEKGIKDRKSLESERSGKVMSEIQERGTGEKARVRITLRDKTEVKGYISHIETDSFQVTGKKNGQVTTIAYTDVDKVRGLGLSRGAKIAIGVVAAGVLAGIAVATLPND